MVILDSGFWRAGRINVVADARLCMYVAGGCGVVNVLWCRKRDITTLPRHVGFTPRGIRSLREETSVKAPPRSEEREPVTNKNTKNPREERCDCV